MIIRAAQVFNTTVRFFGLDSSGNRPASAARAPNVIQVVGKQAIGSDMLWLQNIVSSHLWVVPYTAIVARTPPQEVWRHVADVTARMARLKLSPSEMLPLSRLHLRGHQDDCGRDCL